jgi:hypothetical protein
MTKTLTILAILTLGAAPIVASLATAPSLTDCRAAAGPSGKFATYNQAAAARCDGHLEVWSVR